ncbi:MAG TPA: peptide chain release factor N(5)-glutamine methyltransferase [Dehalococcoidia bacterium]
MVTIAQTLHDAASRFASAGIDDGRLEAEALLAHVVSSNRTQLLARFNEPLAEAIATSFEVLIGRRLAREPLAYIVGHREFYGIDIICAPGALIPRPETELLVDVALGAAQSRGATKITDVGTGTGALAIAIAVNAPDVVITAVDASPGALAIAATNLARYALDTRVLLRHAHLLDGLGEFNVILANLPYIRSDGIAALQPEIREFEPLEALDGGITGTELMDQLLEQAPFHLAGAGILALEVGDTQAASVAAKARDCFPDARVCVIKDLAGFDRVVQVSR